MNTINFNLCYWKIIYCRNKNIYDSIFRHMYDCLSIRYVSVCQYSKQLNRCLVPFNATSSRRWLITITQKANIFFILFFEWRNQHTDTRRSYQTTFFGHIIPFKLRKILQRWNISHIRRKEMNLWVIQIWCHI